MLHETTHGSQSDRPVVEVLNLTCGYEGSVVLRNVDFRVMREDFIALMGPSGSGKTTLLRAILGAVDVYEGDVRVEGELVRNRRPRVGYVPQLESIDWNFPVTVEEVVLMGRTSGGGLMPWHRSEDRDAAYQTMERLGIAAFGRRHIRELSGGQQQRVFLARALISNPSLLLLDEPTGGVDIRTRDEVLHLLDELNHAGVAIVLTTHEINAVAAHLPRVVCLRERVIAAGTPAEVITPEILKETYGAEMPVMEFEGMVLVAEVPHLFGQHHHHAEAEDAHGH
jgi:zinc/manganese transport system ATP-binding protein